MENTLLEMKNISKTFGGIDALTNVNLQIKKGEVLGLIGENGAGKSTLMKILCGIVEADSGDIILDNNKINFDNPHHAQKLGIAMIPQELLLVQEISVTQNMFLGQEINKSIIYLDKVSMRESTIEMLERLNSAHISPDALVGTLPKSDQQILAIARRLLQGGRIFIMDEPTTALTAKETRTLFSIINKLKDEGFPTIFISHRFEEGLEICDRFTILKDGKLIADIINDETVTKQSLIYHMIGTEIKEEYPYTKTERGEEVLRTENLSYKTFQGSLVSDINFSLHKSEVVGITGLAGVGKTELGQAIIGLRKMTGGQLYLDKNPVTIHSPVDAVKFNIGYVSEDRRDEGLVLSLESLYNMTLSCLNTISTASVLSIKKEKKLIDSYLGRLSLKEQYMHMEAQHLSGGNQQKLVILRQILSEAEIIIFDEPTKGIDVGAKSEVARIIGELSKENKSILILSSEPREVLGICDIIYVLTRKGLVGPFNRGVLDYGKLMNIEFEGKSISKENSSYE